MERVRKRRSPNGEDAIQRAVFQNFRIRAGKGVIAMHVANGGYRKPVEAAILKGLGVLAGAPDVIACKPVMQGPLMMGQFFALELKTETGKLSPAQEQTLDALSRAGAIVGVAYGLDQALAWLEKHDLLRGRVA